jgi:hypothetical protein
MVEWAMSILLLRLSSDRNTIGLANLLIDGAF